MQCKRKKVKQNNKLCQISLDVLLKPEPWEWPWILMKNSSYIISLILLLALIFLTVQIKDHQQQKHFHNSKFIENKSHIKLQPKTTLNNITNENFISKCTPECSTEIIDQNNLKIICKNIKESPGIQGAFCINSLKTSSLITLIFSDCIFPTISPGWLPIKDNNIIIKSLTFENQIRDLILFIKPQSFVYPSFRILYDLNFININFQYLQNGIFDGLQHLQSLKFENILSNGYDFGLFQPLVNLVYLQFYNFELKPEEMKNLTGAVDLKQLEVFDGRFMKIGKVPEGAFAFPNVRQIFLTSSSIKSISENAWNSNSIVQIILDNNLLTTLSENLFKNNQLQSIFLGKNRWDCNCDIYWIKKKRKLLQDPNNIICFSPSYLNNYRILDAIFCEDLNNTTQTNPTTITTTKNEPSSTSPTTSPTTTSPTTSPTISPTTSPTTTSPTTSPTTTSPTTSPTTSMTYEQTTTTKLTSTTTTIETPKKVINITCQEINRNFKNFNKRRLFSNLILNEPFQNFTISEDEYLNHVNIQLMNPIFDDITLLTLTNNKINSCFSNIQNSITIDLLPNTKYIFCLINNTNKRNNQISPLNCQSYTTKPVYDERIWLKNADKNLVIGLSIGLFFIIILITAGFVFFIIRNNPDLISGSSRVITVRSRKEILLTEKGLEMPPSPKLSDTTSTNDVSSASYISIPDEEAHVHFWRFNLLMERYKRDFEQGNSNNNDNMMNNITFPINNSYPPNYVDMNLDDHSYATLK